MTDSQCSLFRDAELGLPAGLHETVATSLVTTFVTSLLDNGGQFAPWELLMRLEDHFDTWVRYVLLQAVAGLRCNLNLPRYQRDYLDTVLSEENLRAALAQPENPAKPYQSTIDDLVSTSTEYRNSKDFREAIEFTARFRDYAPYNNMLVRIQNPSCSFYATARDWWTRFERRVKEDARPLLILAPMHPVMLVYDLDATEGKPLPDKVRRFAETEGDWDPRLLDRTLKNARRDGIRVDYKPLSSTNAGFATRCVSTDPYQMRVAIHKPLHEKSRYSTLCHELAHIYLGHLGTDKGSPWPCRLNLSHATVEIEAEAVAYIVSVRCGLKPSSARYLSSYLKDGAIPDTVSIELITKVAGHLEEMGQRLLPKRKPKKPKGKTKSQ